MNCDRCNCEIETGEDREYSGQVLCEDCYIDALSPAKTCDPWATYTASRLDHQELNQLQQAIMDTIGQKGQASAEELMQATGKSWGELEREIAALRHMEMMRAKKLEGGGKAFVRFNDN